MLFSMLEKIELGPGARAFHSLNLPNHRYKRMSEIDFVVLDPSGLLVCEVKGGRVTRAESDGMWEFTNRGGKTTRRPEGPFAQAKSAMWSLRDELEKRLEPDLLSRISFGYCVIFPNQGWAVDSVDEPAELTLDEGDCRSKNELAKGLGRLLRYWTEKNGSEALAAADLKVVRNALRPSFDVAPSLRSRAADASNQIEALTKEQYVGLDWAESESRLLVAGGAGTGKTMLAAEMARRDLGRGSVLFTYQSPVLAAFVASRPTMEGIDVLPITEAVGEVENHESWDSVIVDEAQDVFTVEGMDAVDRLVSGGLDEGVWRCFYDLNNQAGMFGPVDEAMVEYLESTGARKVSLRRNCRNSKPVVIYTQTVTGADLGKPLDGEGPRVEVNYAETRNEQAACLSDEIGRLAGEGVEGGSITILSAGNGVDSVVEGLPGALRRRIVNLDQDLVSGWPVDNMTFATVEDFKGLENDFILLVDIESLEESLDIVRLYVGLSRPRYRLWLVIPSALKEAFRDLRDQHLRDVMAALETAT
jgi:hypothetical protein